MADDTFILNHGSDFEWSFTWPDGAGGAANLTGYTAAFHDAHPDVVDRATVTITNAAVGTIRVSMPWIGPHMTRGKWLHFALVIVSAGGARYATNQLWIDIQ